MDFQTARLLGVRANRVIASAVLISGILAAIVAVMLTVQQPLVTSTFALRETIVVLAGVVVGGMNRLLSATLGGFAIGYASGLLGGALPTAQSQYLPSFLFGLVILTLLVRPGGLFSFCIASPLHDVCWDPAQDRVSARLAVDYFGLYRLHDDDSICHQLPYGAWIRLFRAHGLVLEDLIELRPRADATTSYPDFVPLDWARRWPAENLWKLRKATG